MISTDSLVNAMSSASVFVASSDQMHLSSRTTLVSGFCAPPRKPVNPFRCFNSSPETIRLVMMYVRFPLSLQNVEDLLLERGIDISHEMVRYWWNRLGRCSPATFDGSG